MALEGINRTAWVIGIPCGLYQFMSHTEGTALLFEFEWVL